MLQNHLKLALRNMSRNKFYAGINIAGLTVGIAVCLLIFLWVQDELSYDRFHTNADRIYRVLWEARYGENEWKMPLGPIPVGRKLAEDFPEVEALSQFVVGGYTFKQADTYVREPDGLYADAAFLDVFTLPVVAGDLRTALTQPNSIALTPAMAARYFGTEPAVGQTLESSDGQTFAVVALFEPFPEQSHLQFDFLLSSQILPYLENRRDQWSSASVYTYFMLRPGADPDRVAARLQAFVDKELTAESGPAATDYTRFPFQPITEIHLGPALASDVAAGGSLTYVWLFGIVAVFILLLACINFINLATARSITRAQEVAVRKVLGSHRRQLIAQFFTEAAVYVGIGLLLAGGLAAALLPAFNAFSGKSLSLATLLTPLPLAALSGFALLTVFVTGLIPATVLSSFAPARMLKQQLAVIKGRHWLREGLVVLQFAISAGLIIGTLVIQDQLNFLQTKRLGFDQERILVIDRATALRDNFAPFLDFLRGLPVVEAVTQTQQVPGQEFDSSIFLPQQPSNHTSTSLQYAFVDAYCGDVLKWDLIAGRDFDPALATDTAACLINRAAAERLGWEYPIGKTLNYGGFDQRQVIGVIENFHYQSLHHAVEPLVLLTTKWKLGHIAVRLRPGDLDTQLAAIAAAWEQFNPPAPLDYFFLDQNFQQLYAAEARMAKVFGVFSLLAIFIACLGLFGLATFLTRQRAREVSIRKVLGATPANLVALLSKDFLLLVLIAFLLAAPIAWYLLRQWLEAFAYRIDMQWWMFALAAGLAIAIAFLTVSVQSLRAALSDPVGKLRGD